MIYFDNAATGGRKPDAVISAVSSAVKLCANPGRSGHKLSLACAAVVQNCRSALSDYFNGWGFERVIFTKNCTEALNIAIFGVLRKGDHVVTTCMEHNSVLRPLERLKKSGVITYDVCPMTDGNISPERFASLIKPDTKMAIVTSASNVTGAIPPLDEIRAAIPESVLLVCDGAQGGGHLPLDMRKTGIDALALAGHKGMMGIQGSGALLFSERMNPQSVMFGGTGSESFSLDMPDFYPDALEAGTLAFPAVSSLFEGVVYLTAHGGEIRSKILSMTEYLLSGLKRFPAVRVYSRPNPCGIVALEHAAIQSEFLAQELSEVYSIAVRGGLHCAPLMHAALGTQENGLVRVSLSAFNHKKEIDALLSALKRIGSHPDPACFSVM